MAHTEGLHLDVRERYPNSPHRFEPFSPKNIEATSAHYIDRLTKNHTIDHIRESQNAFADKSVSERKSQIEAAKKQLKGANEQKLKEHAPEVLGMVSSLMQEKLGQTPQDQQLIASWVLNDGMAGEFKTGNGKTLAIGLATGLNAFKGEGVTTLTANQYLAKRDANFLGQVYHELGLTTAVVAEDDQYFIYDPTYNGEDKEFAHLRPVDPKTSGNLLHNSDIIYSYKYAFETEVLNDRQNPLNARNIRYTNIFIDEIDNVLADDAKSPTQIGEEGPLPDRPEELKKFADIAQKLTSSRETTDTAVGDYTVTAGEDGVSIALTEEGYNRLGNEFGLDDATLFQEGNSPYFLLTSAVLANEYHKGQDYDVVDGKIQLLHEGRLSKRRRLQKGLHQAIEAKEGCQIQPELLDIDSLIPQGLYPQFKKLGGLSGTVIPLAKAFARLYQMETTAIPSRFPTTLEILPAKYTYDNEDTAGQKGKFTILSEEVDKAMHTYKDEATNKFAPILINVSYMTTARDIEKRITALLTEKGLTWASSMDSQDVQDKADVIVNTLVATKEGYESRIIANAGKLNTITISADMAGRGTDIPIDDDVAHLGGILNIEAECPKHERKAVQRRDRVARQGLPGRYMLITSLTDDPVFQGEQNKILDEKEKAWERSRGNMTFEEFVNWGEVIGDLHHRWEENLMDTMEIMNLQQKDIQKHREYFALEKQQFLDHPEKKIQWVEKSIPQFVTKHLEEIFHEENIPTFTNSQGQLDETVLAPRTFAQNRHVYAKMLGTFPNLFPSNLEERKQIMRLPLPELHVYVTKAATEFFHKFQIQAQKAQAASSQPFPQDPNHNFKTLMQAVGNRTYTLAWAEHLTDLDDLLSGSSIQSLGTHTRPLDWFVDQAAQLANKQQSRIHDTIVAFFLNPKSP